ncbi:MAG: 50S ribosomal protein L1 [Pseudomonadota bacterium]
MVKISKRMKDEISATSDDIYNLDDAISFLCGLPKVGFVQTIDIAINLGIDPRKPDQAVRGMFVPKNGLGKDVKILAIVSEKYLDDAKKAGADIVGGENIIDDIKTNGVNFDSCIASMDMMPKIGKIAKILGPKGLMPSPKLGTATNDVAHAITQAKAGQIEYRSDKYGILHAGIAKEDFSPDNIKENIIQFVKKINDVKPSAAKGTYIKNVYISKTMSISVKLDISEIYNIINNKA